MFGKNTTNKLLSLFRYLISINKISFFNDHEKHGVSRLCYGVMEK